MNAEKKVIKHLSLEEIQTLIQKEKNKHVFQRLLFIRHMYQENNVKKSCEIVCISNQTGYTWLNRWNTYGYEGLIPHFGGGRPPKLTKEEKEQLKEKLESKDDWMTSEVRALIKKEFGVTYSERQVSRILRSFKMHYAKPYPHDYRRPKNAKELLEGRLKKAANEIQDKCVIGFLDQAAPQTTDNKQRFWSLVSRIK